MNSNGSRSHRRGFLVRGLGSKFDEAPNALEAALSASLFASLRRWNVESGYAEFDHWAGARHMLIRMGLFRACQVFLFSGLLLATDQVISAQSADPSPTPAAAPSQTPQTPQAVQPAQAPGATSVKPETPPKPVIKIAEVVRKVKEEGRNASIRNYIAEDIGIKLTSVDSAPVQAHAMEDAGTLRKLYVVDDTGDLLFMRITGEITVVYLANRAGVLRMGGYFYPKHRLSEEFKRFSKEKAAAGFAAEEEFWTRKISSPDGVVREADLVNKVEEPVTTPEKSVSKPKKSVSKPDKVAAAPANSDQQSNADGDTTPPKKKKISWF